MPNGCLARSEQGSHARSFKSASGEQLYRRLAQVAARAPSRILEDPVRWGAHLGLEPPGGPDRATMQARPGRRPAGRPLRLSVQLAVEAPDRAPEAHRTRLGGSATKSSATT